MVDGWADRGGMFVIEGKIDTLFLAAHFEGTKTEPKWLGSPTFSQNAELEPHRTAPHRCWGLSAQTRSRRCSWPYRGQSFPIGLTQVDI